MAKKLCQLGALCLALVFTAACAAGPKSVYIQGGYEAEAEVRVNGGIWGGDLEIRLQGPFVFCKDKGYARWGKVTQTPDETVCQPQPMNAEDFEKPVDVNVTVTKDAE